MSSIINKASKLSGFFEALGTEVLESLIMNFEWVISLITQKKLVNIFKFLTFKVVFKFHFTLLRFPELVFCRLLRISISRCKNWDIGAPKRKKPYLQIYGASREENLDISVPFRLFFKQFISYCQKFKHIIENIYMFT